MLRLVGIPSLIDEVRINRFHVCMGLIGELWHPARFKCATDNDLFERRRARWRNQPQVGDCSTRALASQSMAIDAERHFEDPLPMLNKFGLEARNRRLWDRRYRL